MGHYEDPELSGRQVAPWSGWLFPIVIAALVVGLASGYLLRYLTADPPAPPPAPVAAPPVAAPPPAPDRTSCARVAEAGSALVPQFRAGVAAIGRLDPSGLQRVLDEVQRLQSQLEGALGGCQAEVAGNGPDPVPPAAPVPGPPGDPVPGPPAAPVPGSPVAPAPPPGPPGG